MKYIYNHILQHVNYNINIVLYNICVIQYIFDIHHNIYLLHIYVYIYIFNKTSSCQFTVKCSPVWGRKPQGLTAVLVNKYHLLIEETTRKQGLSPLMALSSLSTPLGFIKIICMDVLELWGIPSKKLCKPEIACFRKSNLSSLTLFPFCSPSSPSFWPRSCLTSWHLTSI